MTSTYLHPVGLHVADADAGGEGPAGDAADHHWHALLAGAVALLLDLSAQLAVGDVGLVAGAVDGEAPVVLLAALGQQPGGKKDQHLLTAKFSVGLLNEKAAHRLINTG